MNVYYFDSNDSSGGIYEFSEKEYRLSRLEHTLQNYVFAFAIKFFLVSSKCHFSSILDDLVRHQKLPTDFYKIVGALISVN